MDFLLFVCTKNHKDRHSNFVYRMLYGFNCNKFRMQLAGLCTSLCDHTVWCQYSWARIVEESSHLHRIDIDIEIHTRKIESWWKISRCIEGNEMDTSNPIGSSNLYRIYGFVDIHWIGTLTMSQPAEWVMEMVRVRERVRVNKWLSKHLN